MLINKNTPPPSILAALGFFEAVARLQSFSAAGQELGVTQSAVSHRIKQLEAELGFPLFRRTTRRLELTQEGSALFQAATPAMHQLSEALGGIRQNQREGQLTLSVLSSFAVKWLVPHLGNFHATFPDLRLSILAEDQPSALRSDEAGAAIRYGKSGAPGLHRTKLSGDLLIPVASPQLFEQGELPKLAEALAGFPLLADSAGERDGTDFSWDAWCDRLGLDAEPFSQRVYFNRADLMIQAAVSGQGVALGRALLLEQDLGPAAPLIQVGPAVETEAVYAFLCQPEKAAWPKLISCRNWLAREMRKTYAEQARRSIPWAASSRTSAARDP